MILEHITDTVSQVAGETSEASARSAPEPGRPAQPRLPGHHGAQSRGIHVAHRLHLIRVGLHRHIRAGEQDVVHLPNQRQWLAGSVTLATAAQHAAPHAHPPPDPTCPARFSAIAVRQLCTALRRCSPERRLAQIMNMMNSGRLCQQRSTKWAGAQGARRHLLGSYFLLTPAPCQQITANQHHD